MKIESEDIKKNISTNITKYREKANLSQKELAAKLNTSPSRVSNWEQGNNCPSIDILFDVCLILDVSINDIYGVYPSSAFSLSYDEQDHIKKYRSLDPAGQKHVDTVLQWEVDHMNLLEKKDKTIYDLKHQPDKYPHKIYDLGNIVSMVSESSTPYGSVNAAHDNGATPDQAAAADAIMKDDDEWE